MSALGSSHPCTSLLSTGGSDHGFWSWGGFILGDDQGGWHLLRTRVPRAGLCLLAGISTSRNLQTVGKPWIYRIPFSPTAPGLG